MKLAESTYERKYYEVKKENNRLKLEKLNAWIMLPFITSDILEEFKDTDLIDMESNKPAWTQTAVEFACLLSPKRELSELIGED